MVNSVIIFTDAIFEMNRSYCIFLMHFSKHSANLKGRIAGRLFFIYFIKS